MRRALALAAFLIAVPLHAATIEAGIQQVLAVPLGDMQTLDVVDSGGFGAHVEVFWSERLSARVAAVFVNPAAFLDGTDMGTLGLDIYSATARYHFIRRGRFSAFAGGGAAFVDIGDLDDRFDDEVLIEFDPAVTFAVEGGVRYRVHPRIVLELGATYVPLDLEGLPGSAAVDPLVVSVAAAWRF